MRLHKRFLLMLILCLILALSACDNGGGDDDTGNNNQSQATEEVTEEATQESNTPVALTQTATSPDGITVSYPDGWATDTSFGLFIANSASMLEADATTFGDNQVLGSVILLPSTGADDESASTILSGFIQSTLAGGDTAETITFGDIEAFDANGKSAAIVVGSGTNAEGTTSLANIIVNVGDSYVLFSFLAGEGQIEQFLDTLRAIASSVEYAPATDGADG